MERLGDIISQRAGNQPSKPASRPTSTQLRVSRPNTPGCDPGAFSRAMLALTGLKRTASLTEAQVECWYAALGIFPAKTINAAILELCLTETRFPEIGDVYQICRRKLPPELQAEYTPNGSTDPKRPSGKEIAAIAQRLGLEV